MGHVICYKINAIIINWDMNRTTKDNEKHFLLALYYMYWNIKLIRILHHSNFWIECDKQFGMESEKYLFQTLNCKLMPFFFTLDSGEWKGPVKTEPSCYIDYEGGEVSVFFLSKSREGNSDSGAVDSNRDNIKENDNKDDDKEI